MSHFQEKQKRQMTGIRLDEAENQPKRRHESSKPATALRPASQQQRPVSAIMASIMGDQHNRAGSTVGDGRRSESATSGGGGGGRQHKLKQRFTVIRKLGKGTYGKVQLAINKETGQEVAIKTIKKTKIENEQDLERVRREIQIMSSIEHPHIVHIYEVFENKDKIVLIMQYAPGGELYEYVSQSKVLDEHEARRLFRQIATAIYYCHQNKICHRDLKLENILLDEKNNAKLADFGLSNVFDKSRQLKTFCGSPLYASPEIVQGSPYEGPEVDCWSLGVLLYTLVYGAMPFDGSNFKRLVKQISEASYYEPAQRSLASPLIRKLLCADPTKRATILDICSDPWVNGLFASANTPTQQSPRLSPSGGPHHPSLLKVAQDMANLTPVRLDILLALTPRSEATAPPVGEQQEPADPQAINKLAATNQRQIIQPAREQADKTELRQLHEQQEQEKATMISQLGSELMEAADEMRSSSPVASYMVRDLSPTTISPQRMDASQQERPSSSEGGQIGEDKRPTIEEEIEQLEAVTSSQPPAPDQQDVEMAHDVEPTVDELRRNSSATEQAELKVDSTTKVCLPQPAEPGEVVVAKPEVLTPEQQLERPQSTTNSNAQVELAAPVQEVEVLNEESHKKEEEEVKNEPETNHVKKVDCERQVAEKEVKEEKAEGEEKAAAGEEKPKKVKKRIVVVKKRRKVVKKDESNQEEESKEGEQQPSSSGTKSEEGAADSAAAGKKTTSKATSTGPGKVRIPESFDQSAAVQTPQPKQTAARRPSALITDVSQKLMQQAEGQSTAGSSAIEQDLAQLASVKVSDKKSEFERRTSLAAQQSTTVTASGSTSPRDITRQKPVDSSCLVELECYVATREPVKVVAHETQTGTVEPVVLLKPLNFDQLQVSHNKHGSEPLTPTNLRPASLGEQRDETAERLSECAQRLSGDRTEGERSDSVETIKGEGETVGKSLSEERTRNIRSSLQIDLSGAQAASAACQDSAATFQSPNGSVGPAPITRSYKKVTFTKDGTCITETGRIYSTQADDGTMRRIERKSKVTHYPGDDGAAGSTTGGTREETSTHEEIVYESSSAAAARGSQGGGGEFWPRAGVNSRAPLERLIMPSSSFYESEGARDSRQPEEFMYARPSGQLASSNFGRPQPMERADSASSCSSGSTDVFDDIFDTWTGAISMFGQRRHDHRHLSDLRNSLMNRAYVTGSPLPFGRQHSNLTRRDSGGGRHRHRPQSSSGANQPPAPGFFSQQPPPSSASTIGQRCESVEPTSNFEQSPARRRHRHRGPPSANAGSGYESDALEDAAFEQRSLGSARGRFGSSNLFPRHAPEFGHAPFIAHQDPFAALEDELAADPGASLFERMALEHERLRRKFAQQRKQMWKGSTPAGLNEIPEFRPDPMRQQQQQVRQQSSSSRSGSGSHWSTRSGEQRPQQQQQPVKRTSVVFQMGGGGGSGSNLSQLRQSTPLDVAPVRRNTANLAEHLPPRHEQQQQQQQQHASASSSKLVQRSTSKTTFMTSQLANIQLNEQPNSQQQQRSASFLNLNLKRDASSSSSQPPPTSGQAAGNSAQLQQQQPGSAVSSATATFWTDERATPTLGSSGTTGPTAAAFGRPHDLAGGGVQDVEANSRIQSWLLQSAGNLSISSGSKSSTSDATLPSSSGRSDTAAYLLASSAAQMAPLRRDESIRTTTTSSLSIDPLVNQHDLQRTMHSTQSRIILGQPPAGSHQLPPPGAPSRSREKSPMFAQTAPRPAVASSTIIVRSSSRQSLSSEQPDGGRRLAEQSHTVVSRANEVTETIVSGTDGSHQRRQQAARHATTTTTTTSSSAVIGSQKMFAFPNPESDAGDRQQAMEQQQQQEQQRQRVKESRHETVTSTRQQVFSQRAMSPGVTTISGGPTQESWFGGGGGGGGLAQRMTEDDGFDSLGDLESVCSSSLLEQLRARGYRSMINQRMSPSDSTHQSQTTQAATSGQSGTSCNVVTTSSTSMTMSSSSETPQIRHHQIVQQQQQQQTEMPSQQQAVVDAAAQDRLPVPGGATCELASTKQAEGILQTSQPDLQEQLKPSTTTATTTTTDRGPEANDQVKDRDNTSEIAQMEQDDQDEDVREAKANIREYLERMRETEKFLKSMHEEEEKFQRQRQELLLFDNLMLSTKLNGIKPSIGPTHMNEFPEIGGRHPLRVGAGPHSAPIQTNHLHNESLHSNAFMAGKTDGMEPSPQMSCFSSDLYRPMTSSFATMGFTMGGVAAAVAASTTATVRTSDPLEPVRPISMHAYVPVSRNWHRSKSQLGDQFTDYRSRRPLSAILDTSATVGGNVYFPSRQQRSLSQVRYSHHHNNPSVLATSGMNQYHQHAGAEWGDQSPPTMTSEYKSSFGPPSLAPERCHRPSRSPRRATSPLPGGPTYGATRKMLLEANKKSDDDDDEEHLDGLSAYRASSYVPRTLSEVGVTSGRATGTSRPRSFSSWRKDRDERVATGGSSPSSRHRRNSVQATTSSYVKYDKQVLAGDSDTLESSPTRRKSWATSKDSPAAAASEGQTPNSRLSELEQRLQANKKRREELLMGINSGTAQSPPPKIAPTKKKSGRVSSGDESDDDLDHSFGFERPSRLAARGGGGGELNGTQGEKTNGSEQQPAAAATTRARPSRLESMEARIKRRSYCIKLNSPDRSARTKVFASSGTGNKCQLEQKTYVDRERE